MPATGGFDSRTRPAEARPRCKLSRAMFDGKDDVKQVCGQTSRPIPLQGSNTRGLWACGLA